MVATVHRDGGKDHSKEKRMQRRSGRRRAHPRGPAGEPPTMGPRSRTFAG